MAENNQIAKVDNGENGDSLPAVIPQSLNLSRLNNLKQITFIGKMMAQSGMFADIVRDPAKAIVKIIAGQEMGIPPVEACRGLDIIQGQVAIRAELMAARIKSSPKYDFKVRRWDNQQCDIEYFERNEETGKLETQGMSTFSMEDAKAAGLLTKDMWRKYPRNMLYSRAMSNGQSVYAPDVFLVGKVYTPEELEEVPPARASAEVPDDTPELPPVASPAPAVADAPDNNGAVGDPDERDVEEPGSDKSVEQAMADGDSEPPVGFLKQEEPHVEETPKPPAYVVPDYKKGSTQLPRPDMQKLFKKWARDYGLTTPDLIAEFSQRAIGKKAPQTFDDYMLILGILADEMNGRAEQAELV